MKRIDPTSGRLWINNEAIVIRRSKISSKKWGPKQTQETQHDLTTPANDRITITQESVDVHVSANLRDLAPLGIKLL